VPAGVIDHVNKITNQSVIEQPVVEVAADAGRKQAEREMNQPALVSTKKKDRKNHNQSDNGDGNKKVTFARCDSESGAWIFGGSQPQEAVYNYDGASRRAVEPGEYGSFAP